MVVYPESFSVKPNTEATLGFRNLFKTAAQAAVNKNLTLPKGNYVFFSKNAEKRTISIADTTARDDYNSSSACNVRNVAVVIENVKNMEIDCNNSVFITDGDVSSILLKGCENIVLKNLTIACAKPNMHKITILKASPFYVTFCIDSESDFIEENGEYYWCGTDYKMSFTDLKCCGGGMPTARPENLSHLNKSGEHPLCDASSIRRVSERTFTARYLTPKSYAEGQVFYAFSQIPYEMGIIIEDCKKITLKNVVQNYNHGFGVVAQNSEYLKYEGLTFTPVDNKEIDISSPKDFLHFKMCRGKISVNNCIFEGTGGNACSVSGILFKIAKTHKDKTVLEFCNPKVNALSCIKEGDVLVFIDPVTFEELGTTRVLKASLKDDCFYDITTSTYDAPVGEGGLVLNISSSPDFEFIGNSLNKITENGVCVATGGRVRIENNKFLNTGDSAVCFDWDAVCSYQGGFVRDAIIRANAFMSCDDAILIKPENKEGKSPVHSNILIENNLFVLNETHALEAFNSADIIMRGNTYAGKPENEKWVCSQNTQNLITDIPK